MKTRYLLITIAALVISQTGCKSIRTSSFHDPKSDGSNLSTFDWNKKQKNWHGATSDERQVRVYLQEAIQRNLTSRGYTKVDTPNPSFLVSHRIRIVEKSDVVEQEPYDDKVGQVGARFRTDSGWQWMEEPQEEVIRYYEEGTLVVDVTTPAGKVIWRGIASTEVKRALEREARRERLDKAIDQLFREFPWSR